MAKKPHKNTVKGRKIAAKNPKKKPIHVSMKKSKGGGVSTVSGKDYYQADSDRSVGRDTSIFSLVASSIVGGSLGKAADSVNRRGAKAKKATSGFRKATKRKK